MPWQDIIFGVGSALFAIALLPSVFSKDKPALQTSVLTAATLSSFVPAYISLGLWFGATTGAVTAALWWVLVFQKWQLGSEK